MDVTAAEISAQWRSTSASSERSAWTLSCGAGSSSSATTPAAEVSTAAAAIAAREGVCGGGWGGVGGAGWGARRARCGGAARTRLRTRAAPFTAKDTKSKRMHIKAHPRALQNRGGGAILWAGICLRRARTRAQKKRKKKKNVHVTIGMQGDMRYAVFHPRWEASKISASRVSHFRVKSMGNLPLGLACARALSRVPAFSKSASHGFMRDPNYYYAVLRMLFYFHICATDRK